MKFKTHNDKEINVDNTGFVGYVKMNYKDLTRCFGESDCFDNDKSDAEWIIEFEDGIVATIYNYKDGKNYCGNKGTPIEKIEMWHVGGVNEEALKHVVTALDEYTINALRKITRPIKTEKTT